MFEHKYLESLPLYAAGALAGNEAAEIEQHLKTGCPICESELWMYQESLSRLPFALPNHPLPAALKEKIRGKIDQDFPSRESVSWGLRFGRTAAVVAFVALASLLWRQNQLFQEKEKQIAEIQALLSQQKQQIEWLKDPSVQLAMLSGLEAAPDAKGKMVWSPSAGRGIFYANSLPSPGSGKTYQLWVIGSRGPVSAGIFDPGASGSAVVTILPITGDLSGINQCAVTIEPSGGVPQPTGSMVLAGKIL